MYVPQIVPNTLIKGDLIVRPDAQLPTAVACRFEVEETLKELELKVVDISQANPGNDSFSMGVMLLESGLEIHTWPERRFVQLNVHLCDYSRDNFHLTCQLFRHLADFFGWDQKASKLVVLRTSQHETKISMELPPAMAAV